MVPYFFAGGHWKYPRDSIVNLRMDISMLFFSNFKKINWPLAELFMNVLTNDNKLISINKWIAVSHHHVKPSLTALRALSGYNSVSMMFGISKSKI